MKHTQHENTLHGHTLEWHSSQHFYQTYTQLAHAELTFEEKRLLLSQIIFAEVYHYCMTNLGMPLAIDTIQPSDSLGAACIAGEPLAYSVEVYMTMQQVGIPDISSWYGELPQEIIGDAEAVFHAFVESVIFAEEPEEPYRIIFAQHVEQIQRSFNTLLAQEGITFEEYCARQGSSPQEEHAALFAAAHHATRVECVSHSIAQTESYEYDSAKEMQHVSQIGDLVSHSLGLTKIPETLLKARKLFYARKTMQQQFARQWLAMQIQQLDVS